jgi:hypothetical protein
MALGFANLQFEFDFSDVLVFSNITRVRHSLTATGGTFATAVARVTGDNGTSVLVETVLVLSRPCRVHAHAHKHASELCAHLSVVDAVVFQNPVLRMYVLLLLPDIDTCDKECCLHCFVYQDHPVTGTVVVDVDTSSYTDKCGLC